MAFDPSTAEGDRFPISQGQNWDVRQVLLKYPDIADVIEHSTTLEEIVPSGFGTFSNPQERVIDMLFGEIYPRTGNKSQHTAPQRALAGPLAHRLHRSKLDYTSIIRQENESVQATIILVSHALSSTRPRAFGRQYNNYVEDSRDYEARLQAYANAIGKLCARYNIDLYALLRTQDDPNSRDGLIGVLMDKYHIFG